MNDALILKYLDIWNERDAAAREALMRDVLTDDSVYSDPDYAGLRGHGELSEAIGRAQRRFGDMVFTLGSVIDAHHDTALFTWKLGASAASGYDVVEFSGDRIRRVVGFFE
ncbi:MAG: nuclear transport factor 2 family protein [Thermoactinospora sp.]|nr:nuclear transport factor 2 family protein [Thermoactinospora sp.]